MAEINLRATGILNDMEQLKKCGNNYVDIYDQFCQIVNSLKEDKILSSHMINCGMDSTLDQMKTITNLLKDHCNVFTTFLKEDVVENYEMVDQESAKRFDVNVGKRLMDSDE